MKQNEILVMECGDSSLLIECVDAYLPGEAVSTEPTSLADTVKKIPKDIFANLGTMAKDVAEEFKNGIGALENMPKEIELEFNFAITTSGKLLVLSGDTEIGIKLKLKWKT